VAAPFRLVVTNRAFAILITGSRRSEAEVAAAAGLETGTISSYASGWKKLSMKTFLRLTRKAGFQPGEVEDALSLASRLGPGSVGPRHPPVPASELGFLAERLLKDRLPWLLHEAVAWEERRRFRELWRGMKDLKTKDWKAAVTELPRLARWGLCERLAEESAEAASHDADRALELAELSLWVAERVPAEDSPLTCQGHAWGYVGNARRVKSRLRSAEAAFVLSDRLSQEGAESDPKFLDGSRLLGLKASLRIGQRRLPEAQRLLAEAASKARTDLALGRILIKDAYVQELTGDYESAVATLGRTAGLIPETETRLRCVLRFNWMTNLCHLGQAAAAEPMLPDLFRLAAQIGNGLGLVQVRLRWLTAKIDAGVGRIEKATEALSRVRAEFAEKTIRYDEALASMELAGLYLELGRTAEVKRLVRLMAPVFEAEGIHAEAQKALALFRRAVELETVTAELVRRLVAYLYRAQHDPAIHFEERP